MSYRMRTQYAIDHFFEKNYFDVSENSYELQEQADRGKSLLYLENVGENLCVSQFDSKSKCKFLRKDREYGLQKCSDHILFQHIADDSWTLLIIEMKTSVGAKVWKDIKKKRRASYLNALAIAAVLDIQIKKVIVYTTFEEEKFSDLPDLTSPYAQKPVLGHYQVDYKKDEWDRNVIYINLGEALRFEHHHIRMNRNEDGSRLEGKYDLRELSRQESEKNEN